MRMINFGKEESKPNLSTSTNNNHNGAPSGAPSLKQNTYKMKYQVTRTYNNNCDVIKRFNKLSEASEFFFKAKTQAGITALIELEEVKY